MYLCDLDDTSDIVENIGNQYFEAYSPNLDWL